MDMEAYGTLKNHTEPYGSHTYTQTLVLSCAMRN